MFFPYQALAIRELSKNMFQVFDVRFHIQRFNSKCEMCVSASYLESLIACNFRYFLYDHFSDIVIQVSYVLLYVKQRLFPPYYSLFIIHYYPLLFTRHQENSRLSLPFTYTKHVIVHGTDLTCCDLSHSCLLPCCVASVPLHRNIRLVDMVCSL